MRPVVVSSPAAAGTSQLATSAGASAAVIIDYHLTPANIGLAIEYPAGVVATTQIELTLDDPFAANFATTAVWFIHPTLVGITANSVDNISIPARAVRLNNTAWTSGSPTLTVVQAGGIA